MCGVDGICLATPVEQYVLDFILISLVRTRGLMFFPSWCKSTLYLIDLLNCYMLMLLQLTANQMAIGGGFQMVFFHPNWVGATTNL